MPSFLTNIIPFFIPNPVPIYLNRANLTDEYEDIDFYDYDNTTEIDYYDYRDINGNDCDLYGNFEYNKSGYLTSAYFEIYNDTSDEEYVIFEIEALQSKHLENFTLGVEVANKYIWFASSNFSILISLSSFNSFLLKRGILITILKSFKYKLLYSLPSFLSKSMKFPI